MQPAERPALEPPGLDLVGRNLRNALAMELFVEFGFIVALMGTLGAFNGGQSTNTPPFVQAYLVIGFLVTIPVAIRTWQWRGMAVNRDVSGLRRANIAAWAVIALFFSAILPSIYLNAAAAVLREMDMET